MISLEQFINESARTTNSNGERRAELEKWLKNKKYNEYVKILDKMLDDPKAKTLLVDGFGGDLGNTKFTYSVKLIPASNLRPTQSEIDVDKSLKIVLTNTKNIINDFSDEIVITNMPLVTFRGNYIIDGHHRWSEVAMINPDGKMVCFDYDADISPIQMLKAVQGSIAAVMAEKNEKDMPSGSRKGPNLYNKKWNKEAIKKYIKQHITTDVEKLCYKYFDNCNTFDDILEIISSNAMELKYNNYPEDNSPNRVDMPQTDKGRHGKDTTSAYPDSKGSALHKMKTGKFVKSAIK
jgi:hypothetical protein